MNNPFIPFVVTAWLGLLAAALLAEFKSWAWMIWTPYLLIATAAPIIWHWRNAKRTGKRGAR